MSKSPPLSPTRIDGVKQQTQRKGAGMKVASLCTAHASDARTTTKRTAKTTTHCMLVRGVAQCSETGCEPPCVLCRGGVCDCKHVCVIVSHVCVCLMVNHVRWLIMWCVCVGGYRVQVPAEHNTNTNTNTTTTTNTNTR